ncbi:MAG TPA: recombinase zinc beta ribbon domain-containing protein, partial [Bacteroidota bacterium]|nr:recombinase zinc beta ribbon domain-containing protein [Bacteroidota bacterium]
LRNKIYTGQITFESEQFKGLHEAIVDETLFEKVQKRLDQSARDPYATYEDSPLLLLGLTKCGFCDGQLTTYYPGRNKTGRSYYYYQCTTNSKSGPHKCPSRNLPARELERFTEKLALHAAKDQGFFDAVVRQVKGNAQTSLGERRNERDAVALNQVSIKKQLDTFISNLTLAHVDVSQSTEVKSKVDELTNRVKELDRNLSELDHEIEMLRDQQIDKAQLKQVFDGFEEMYADATAETKRKLLNTIIEEIRCSVKYGEKTGEIEFRLRGDSSVKEKWEESRKKEHGESRKPALRHFDSPCSLAPRAGLEPATLRLR